MKTMLNDHLAGFKAALIQHESEVSRLKDLIKLTERTLRDLAKIELNESEEPTNENPNQ